MKVLELPLVKLTVVVLFCVSFVTICLGAAWMTYTNLSSIGFTLAFIWKSMDLLDVVMLTAVVVYAVCLFLVNKINI